MKVSEQFRGSYLKATDLNGKPKNYTIESVSEEEVGDDRKAVLRFTGCKYGLVLNKTNAEALAEAFGDETDDWAGQAIQLYPDRTSFNGKTVACVRVRVPAAAPVAAPAGGDDVNY